MIKELFHNQGTSPQIKSFPQKIFSLIKEIFHKQESFLQTKIYLWSKKFTTNKDFYTVKKIFCKERSKRLLLFSHIKFKKIFTLKILSTHKKTVVNTFHDTSLFFKHGVFCQIKTVRLSRSKLHGWLDFFYFLKIASFFLTKLFQNCWFLSNYYKYKVCWF